MTTRPVTWPGQRGVAAVELAIIMIIMTMLLPVTMYIARLLWNHLVLLHATHASAATIASLSIAELNGIDALNNIVTSRAMIQEATDAAHIEPMFGEPQITCWPAITCNNMKGGTVTITAVAQVTELNFRDPIFLYDSPDGITYLRVVPTVPYANRPLAY
ncbi:hypothetical protein E4L96_14990 [Massilia arenosa]|uniref:TadE-like domain-containing protein n=1 Tax=Zemynaea arenosa TaxID=2561931 RepID=A0A4Y9S6I0_9BURK|nr:TadE family protein [Massilia arenosa]TFW17144.1 hypothetical protein E4L96_14990 [Massilia arenosa]